MKNEVKKSVANEFLTPKEHEFASKVNRFLYYYKKDILYANIQYWKKLYSSCIRTESMDDILTSEIALNCIAESSFNILVSMFALFNQNKTINLKNINSFSRKNLNCKQKTFLRDISQLYMFFYNNLYFDYQTGLPVPLEKCSFKNSLDGCTSFLDFKEIYSKAHRHCITFEVAIAAIWFIDRYF